MKATYTKQDDFTLIEKTDFITMQERCFLSNEVFNSKCLTISGEDKEWLAEVQEILQYANWDRHEFEFTFKRTSKKRFEFTLTRLEWPEMFDHYDEDEEVDECVVSKVMFKWVAQHPDWVLMEAVKRYSGYFDLKNCEESQVRVDKSHVPF